MYSFYVTPILRRNKVGKSRELREEIKRKIALIKYLALDVINVAATLIK